ncbi:peroxiredoxin family protein [Ktedonosporobacter rubrisoli]|uniref:peroxiredoxin family protein n=1 Tax=Ktedonosporobacter rubrisoli TaxID=2509675 RepID=UPI0013EE9B44|nr:redoxin domain-containing protein [Ktedonosporobacter rubrisoli]
MESFLLVSSILLWVVVILNLLLTLALIRRVNTKKESTQSLEVGPPLGSQAPDFSAQTLNDETMTLEQYAGRPTTFVFVSPGCGPCSEFIPSLTTLVPQMRSTGAELVLVSNGTRAETAEMVRELADEVPVLIATRPDNPFFKSYSITLTPSFCSLDEQGLVLATGHPNDSDQQWRRITTDGARQKPLVDRR